jgi:hypothetical protein
LQKSLWKTEKIMSQTRPKSKIYLLKQILMFVAVGFFLLIGIVISQHNKPTANTEVGTALSKETSEPQSPTALATPFTTKTLEPKKSHENTPTVIHTIDQVPTSGAMMVLSQNVNGIEITAHNIRRGENMLKADICFPVVDSEDWMINQIALQYNGKEIRDWGGSLINPIIPAGNGKQGRRCDMVYFSVPDQEEISEFTINVISIYAPPREGGMCERIDTIQKQLDRQDSGIKIKCQEGNGMAGYQIVAKPDTVGEEEAQKIIMNAMNHTIQGPWKFTVRLK